MVIDSAGVGNAGNAKFVSICRMHHGGRKGLWMGLCGKGTNESEKKAIAFHIGLGCRIL